MDQPAEQIEQFITMLRNTGAQVGDDLHHVESESAALDHLAEDVHEQLAAFSHELEGMLSELAHDEQAAAAEVDHLGDAAHAIADTRFAAAQDHLEHAESSLNQALEGVRGHLDQDAAGLHDQGFQPFAGHLHTADAGLDAARSEADHAFDALHAAVQSQSQELEAAAHEVESALQHAATALREEDKHQLETEAHECVNGLHQLAPQVVSASDHAAESAHQLYGVWAHESDSEAHELEEALSTLYQGAAEAVTQHGSEKVVEPAEHVAGQAAQALMEELGEQASALEAHQQSVASLPQLASELEIASNVIGTIDELIKSMAE
ncbi:MAG TPA: hypothetical protein VEQ10_15590 [Vicinamibacteria bacterium]|nr:hypothetical protein [Vicinamibacteria bacterium]